MLDLPVGVGRSASPDPKEGETAAEVEIEIQDYRDWLDSCASMAAEGHASDDGFRGMSAQRFDQYWRTMLVGRSSKGTRLSDVDGEAFRQYCDLMEQLLDKGPELHSRLKEQQHVLYAIEPLLGSFAVSLWFCVTKNDRLAQVPKHVVVGDEICVFQGGEVPFVVRRLQNGHFKLIGECYVNGVMDGEAIEGDDLVTQTIELE